LPKQVTWGSVHGHVAEVAAFDDVNSKTTGRAIVREAKQQFRHAAMLQ